MTTEVTPLSAQKNVPVLRAYCSENLRIKSMDFSLGSSTVPSAERIRAPGGRKKCRWMIRAALKRKLLSPGSTKQVKHFEWTSAPHTHVMPQGTRGKHWQRLTSCSYRQEDAAGAGKALAGCRGRCVAQASDLKLTGGRHRFIV